MASKYDHLTAHLNELGDEAGRITLSFPELASIIPDGLPPIAYRDRPWWANTMSSGQGRSWMTAGWRVASVDLQGRTVIFERADRSDLVTRAAQTIQTSNYRALQRFLTDIPMTQSQVALSLEDIERAARRELPATARHDRPWWANTKKSPQGNAWMTAGWRVEQVYLAREMIVFRRPNSDVAEMIRRNVKSLMSGRSRLDRPGAADLAQWIRTCRQLGWFFEATTLYENYLMTVDAMDTAEAAEIEEDYRVCKLELTRHQNVPK